VILQFTLEHCAKNAGGIRQCISPNVNWLAWQRLSTHRKNRSRSIISMQSAVIGWKSVQYMLRYSAGYAVFAMSWPKSSPKLCQLWSYWTKLHKILPQYRGIIDAVNMYIDEDEAIFHSVLKCHSNKWQEFVIFPENWLSWQCPLRNLKRGPDRSSTSK